MRDPRDVAKSYSNHNSTSIEESINYMKEFNIGGGVKSKDRKNETITHLGSWSSHYTSWKEFDKVDRYLLIKYEDLVKETEKTFLKVLTFVCKLTKKKLDLDKNKLKNVLNTTSFESMQKLEKQNGFNEASNFNGKKVTFFKYGAKNNWKKFLTLENKKKIEDIFREEMKELGYL